MPKVHFFNLTRGQLCGEELNLWPPMCHYTRIQSTACEQKLWDDVLRDAGADLLYHLATGQEVIVHDRSERPRRTRALWQGLVWLRFACERAWEVPLHLTHRAVVRNGHDATLYFAHQWDLVSDRDRKRVRYFRKFWAGGPVNLTPCNCGEKG